ncbi:hypothetical protein M378DRAFT_13401 [Amanita muscaria Koide BX008]|uniref:Uncharacterized protein n=1 Tax=Amanita muscaria (strain Koide BX008) TaxID=946122 RepID=A0A0C2WJ97_AMAMK|nr:hypothetical protein M378DRAFT_13401 [Amanita muscaria Koide BX008]
MAVTEPKTPVSRTEKQAKKRQNIDKVLGATLEVLNSGTATRFPIVQTAFGCAARIFEIAQKVRANQDEFIEFAEEGCRLVYSIYLKLKDNPDLESNLKADLQELLNTLESIETFGEKCAARGTFKAVLLHGFDGNEIQAQRRKLERCMRLFEFQSLLDLREKTNQLIEQHGTNGGVSTTATNKGNVTENKISFGNNANFGGANGNVMGSGNVVNHNSNNHGAGAGHRSTNSENTNNRLNNSISFGSGANFSNSTSNAFGANNEINVNSNNRSGNLFGSDNAANNNSQNRSQSNGDNGNAQNDHQRTLAGNSNKTNNSNNVTKNDIQFGDDATFTGANGNVFGANNQISHNSHNVHDNSTNVHNNGSHNTTVSHWGNNNQTHIGNNNSGNQGVIGDGSHNTVNSGANSGHQFFPNAQNFTIAGGEFSAVGGNNIRNNYGVGHLPN